MNTFKKIIFLSLFALLYVGCSSDSDIETPIAPQAYIAQNVSYGADDHQVFDIYLPKNRTMKTKVVILIHGGSWITGDKSEMELISGLLSASHPDVGIVNMNYTLADAENPPFPMQIDDVSAVVDYISSNKSTLIMSDNIGFIGASAGAHLSLLWSYAYDTNNQVDMVCSIVGPVNFTDPAYNGHPAYQSLYQLFGSPSIDFLETVSPYHRATTTSPPTLLFYGGMDPLVPTSQGEDMDEKLTTLGVTHEFHFYPEEGHGWEGANLLDTSSKISTYIERYMGSE